MLDKTRLKTFIYTYGQSVQDGGLSHAGYVSNVNGLSPVGFWPMVETSGTTVDDESGNSHDGSYVGDPTLASHPGPFGQNVPDFDATGDYANLFSAGLATALGTTTSGTIACWLKARDADVWTDNTTRVWLEFTDDASNYVQIRKLNTGSPNDMNLNSAAAGTAVSKTFGDADTDWVHMAAAWDTSEIVWYVNGVDKSTPNTFDTFAGAITVFTACANSVGGANWDGYLSYVAVWDSKLSAANIDTLRGV